MQPDRTPIVVIGAVEEARCPRTTAWKKLWQWLLRPPLPALEPLTGRADEQNTDDRKM
jgi:hypothetical protein